MTDGVIGKGVYRGYGWAARVSSSGIKCAYVDIDQNHYLLNTIFPDGRDDYAYDVASRLIPAVRGGVTFGARSVSEAFAGGCLVPGHAVIGWDYGHASDIRFVPGGRMECLVPDVEILADVRAVIDYILSAYDV